KRCPRCHAKFECKVGNVANCQCSGIAFSVEEKAFLEERYNDCLCRNCLLELKQRYVFFKEKYLYNA
ncbi:MAG: cysteine-rich CWC family protein, partial [Bacteroidetes bacterium]|nr:cysteine-rich CWC family protein [Bacteroidota bacterium]